MVKQVTLDISDCYDNYKYDGGSFDKITYNLGLEYRPMKSLPGPGQYGTAFKAPTLSDEYQGDSGFFTSSANDYYFCTTHYGRSRRAPMPAILLRYHVGQPRPQTHYCERLGWRDRLVAAGAQLVRVDYLHWKITNEVQEQDTDQLLRTESACLLGQLDLTSPTCVAAIAKGAP